MGIRCDQHMGLTDAAMAYLVENEVEPDKCPTCERSFPKQLEVCGKYSGMYDNEYKLFRHPLKNGDHADEYLQDQPWSSGPVAFLGLNVFDKQGALEKQFIWSDDEIDNA